MKQDFQEVDQAIEESLQEAKAEEEKKENLEIEEIIEITVKERILGRMRNVRKWAILIE
jgi:hypothetical protein